ncbi:hypothetical protein BJY04DRAFT_221984 [Aspergillus karnatakaensis]|uniref:F-box protein n=1 Tax=Aspergillus karnatakaensis TaxID=1810916 RepID=UPI003CCDFEAA
MAGISLLPPEVLDQICCLLLHEDLYALRLTCKTLASKSYDHFGSRTCSEIYLALTKDGLGSLKELANNDVLRLHVKALWIIPTLFGAQYSRELQDIVELDRKGRRERAWLDGVNLPEPRPVELPPPVRPPSRLAPNNPFRRTQGGYEARAAALREQRRQQLQEHAQRLRDTPPSPSNKEHYEKYQKAVSDLFQILLRHTQGRTQFHQALASCLPRFPNLSATGLKDYPINLSQSQTKALKRKIKGLTRLEQQLGYNPLHISEPLLWTSRNPPARFTTSLLQSVIFTTLMVVIGEVGTQIQTLETRGLMADDGLCVMQAQEDQIRPRIYQLRHLSLNICSTHTQQSQRVILQKEADRLETHLQSSNQWAGPKAREA